jgi:hypothetical protein
VDQAFFYVALYDPKGVDRSRLDPLLSSIPGDLVASGILIEEERSKNSLVVCSVPMDEGRGAQLHLPYFLLPLPRSSIKDILHGRMVVLNLVNSGRVAEALEDAGFSVDLPTGRNDLGSGSMVVRMTVEDSSGARFAAEWHQMKLHLDEMTMEFRPLRYILDVAAATRQAIGIGLEDRRRRQIAAADDADVAWGPAERRDEARVTATDHGFAPWSLPSRFQTC